MVEGALEVREQKYNKKKNIKINVLPLSEQFWRDKWGFK